VLTLLLERPDGIRADEVAKELGKSTSTAYYLLTSLCDEGYAVHESKGVYRRARGLEGLSSSAQPLAASPGTVIRHSLAGVVDELFLRTRKRSYLGVLRGGRIQIVAVQGRQGVRRMPGLGSEIRDSAHALAMGKIVLSLLGPAALARYIARELKAFTPHTIVEPSVLRAELEQVKRDGFAVDREEFDTDFCCVAAPILDPHGRFIAAIGLSVTPHVFDAERDQLAATVIDVARGAGAALAARAAAPREPRGGESLAALH
jgi:acetyl-CoA synthetase